jgi:hypothetical protein
VVRDKIFTDLAIHRAKERARDRKKVAAKCREMRRELGLADDGRLGDD